MISIYGIFGITAGLLQFWSLLAYVNAIYHGETKPNKMTWWVLAILNTLVSASYFASGARETIWLPISYALGYYFVAVLSVRFGEGSWSRLEQVCLAGAILTIPVWWLSKSAPLALALNIIIDFFGLAPTMYKSYIRPWTEDKKAWIIALVASLFNVLAVTKWVPIIGIYPVYIFVTNAIIVAFLVFTSRERLAEDTR
jgi:hypothetical protein